MLEDQIAELFDVDLVRLWDVDDDGNAVEKDIEIETPEIEVNIQGDGQSYWIEGSNGIVESGTYR